MNLTKEQKTLITELIKDKFHYNKENIQYCENYMNDQFLEAETISASLIKLSDADLINKRKDLSNSINKIIESLNEMGVDE